MVTGTPPQLRGAAFALVFGGHKNLSIGYRKGDITVPGTIF
jgi:hypothetical protein